MLRILCLCRLAGRRANRESRLIPPRVGNIIRISFIAHLPCVEGVYESVPVLGRFLQNGAAQASCGSVSCAPVDTAARIMLQTPPRAPEGSVPWRGRFLCSGYPLPAFVGLSYATKGGACWAIPGMQTARCAVSIGPDLKRWRPSAAYARAVSVQFTMTSLLIPRIHFLSSLMKLDQFQSGKHSDTPLLEQQQRTGRICSLHTIFVMHKRVIR